MPTKRRSNIAPEQNTKSKTRADRSRSRHQATIKVENQDTFIRTLTVQEQNSFQATLQQRRQSHVLNKREVSPSLDLLSDLDLDLELTKKQQKTSVKPSKQKIQPQQSIIEVVTKRVTRQSIKKQTKQEIIETVEEKKVPKTQERILNTDELKDFQEKIAELKKKKQRSEKKTKMEEEPFMTADSTNVQDPNMSEPFLKTEVKDEAPTFFFTQDQEHFQGSILNELFPKYIKTRQIFEEENDISTSISKPIKPSKVMLQYASVLQQLHENSLPTEIPCRDSEKLLIENFLKEGLNSGGQSQALYISGVPGIGKTASFLEVKNKLQSSNKFTFAHINGMNLSSPETLYCQLLFELTGIDNSSRNQACLILTELFTKGKLPTKYKSYEDEKTKGNKVILLDECDFLVTQNQQLLYNLVDWPSYNKSRLTIVMIANTMDFPERLKPKLQSRLGSHRLVYRPYSSQQIEQIVTQRIQNSAAKTIFQSDALTFVSKKVATVSTDIRKTLNICRNSVELARDEITLKSKKLNKVTIEHVKAAYNKVYSQPYHFCLTHLNNNLKLLLISIALEAHFKGYNVAYMSNVCPRYNQLSSTYCGTSITYNQAQLTQMLAQLKAINLLDTKDKQWIQNPKVSESSKIKQESDQQQRQQFYNVSDLSIQLAIGIDDLKNSLKDDTFFAKFSGLF